MHIHATDTGTWYPVSTSDERPVIHGRQAPLLAWLMGRSTGEGLTTGNHQPLPTPPPLY
jgi:maleylpyruvate isomerase